MTRDRKTYRKTMYISKHGKCEVVLRSLHCTDSFVDKYPIRSFAVAARSHHCTGLHLMWLSDLRDYRATRGYLAGGRRVGQYKFLLLAPAIGSYIASEVGNLNRKWDGLQTTEQVHRYTIIRMQGTNHSGGSGKAGQRGVSQRRGERRDIDGGRDEMASLTNELDEMATVDGEVDSDERD